MNRDQLRRTILAVLDVTRVPLTAGGVYRLIRKAQESSGNTYKSIGSESTFRRIMADMANQGEIATEKRTIEKNGFLVEASHYSINRREA